MEVIVTNVGKLVCDLFKGTVQPTHLGVRIHLPSTGRKSNPTRHMKKTANLFRFKRQTKVEATGFCFDYIISNSQDFTQLNSFRGEASGVFPQVQFSVGCLGNDEKRVEVSSDQNPLFVTFHVFLFGLKTGSL